MHYESISEWVARRPVQILFDSTNEGRVVGRFFAGTIGIKRNGVTREYQPRRYPDGTSRTSRIMQYCEEAGWEKHDDELDGPLIYIEKGDQGE